MAVASETDIANRALSKLGDVRITDISQDNTKAARAMNHRFEFLRDLTISSYPWRFAMEIASLAADSTDPAWGFAKRYLLPTDCLRLITIGDVAVNADTIGVQYRVGGEGFFPSDAPFEVIGQYIHTDISAPLKVIYLKQITDTGLFPDIFVEMLACRLAYDACEELTQSSSKKQDIEREFRSFMMEAYRIDALQRPPGRRAPGRWMLSRVG